jgi:hypothetical protein
VVCERSQRPLVVAYDPSSSRVVNMMRARGATRMPPDRALPEADIALFERWILDGARRTPGGPPAATDPYAPEAGVDGATPDAADGSPDRAADATGDRSADAAADAGADTAARDGGGG